MADDVKKLLLQIDATTELLKRELRSGDSEVARFERDTKRRLDTIDRSFAGLGRGVDTLKGRFNSFRGVLAAIGVSFGIAQITAFTRRSFELASSLGETAAQLGVTTRALQLYRFIGGQAGIAQEELDRSLQKFNRTLGDAALGVDRPRRALLALGFSLEEIRRGLTVDEALPRVADGLARVESSARRAAVEALLFGRAGQQLDPLLSQGGARINELADAAERMGYVLSDEQIARLDDAADRYAALKTLLEARIAAAVSDNAESIMELVQALIDLVGAAGRAVGAWRSFRLEMEASGIQNELNAGNTPPEWGMGGTGQALTPQRRLELLQRQADIRAEQLRLARANDPNYRPPAPPRPTRREGTGTPPDLDEIEGGGASASTARTNAQAFADFEAALRRRGINRAQGRTGFRTTRDQQEIHAAGDSPLDGIRRISRHQTHQALDPTRRSHRDEDALAAAQEAGLRGFEIVRESGNRVHYEWTGHGARGDLEAALEEQERQEEEARRAREEALRAEFQFDSEMRRARSETLGIQRDLSTDYSEQATISARMLDLEREQEFAALELSVTLGDRTRAQADQLKAEYEISDGLRRQQILVDEQTQRREEYERLQAVSAEIQRSLLEGEADLATTAAERRRVELRILDLAYEEERARLERIIALGRGDADEEEARRRLGSLSERQAQERAITLRNTQGPLARYLDQIPDTADEISEALERIQVDGLEDLTDEASRAAAAVLGLRGAVGNLLVSLARLALQRGILALLGGGGGGKIDSGAGGAGDAILSAVSFASKLFSATPRAIGGGVSPNRLYEVGERGRELFVPNIPGQIIPNHALRGGEAPRERVDVFVHPSEEFELKVVRTSAGVVGQMTPQIAANEAGKALAALMRQGLP